MVYQETASTQLNEKSNKISPPGPPELSIAGISPFLGQNVHVVLNQLAKKYGDIFQLRAGDKTLVALNGYDAIKEALVKQQDKFSARADFDIFQQSPQSEFLELKSGESWKRHREIIGQVMHLFLVGKSDIHESWIIEEVDNLVDSFLSYDGQPVNPSFYMPLATLSFMQRLMFDEKGSTEDADLVTTAQILDGIPHGLLNSVKLEILPEVWKPIFRNLRQDVLEDFPKGMGTLHSYVTSKLEQHREGFDPENLRHIADGFIKATSELTEYDRVKLGLSADDIVVGSLIQFAGAGGELPSLMLRWALLYMIAYPDIQTKIQKELDEVIGRKQNPSFKDRGKLPFTEACISEIFRHSSATVMPPINYATSEDAILKGYFIPQNTPLLVNYYSLTRDERYWEEPEQFNPYRFLDENGNLKNELLEKFYPFGVGPRRCVGEYLGRLQVFVFFTNLIHKCRFERVSGEKLSFESTPAAFLSPENYQVVVKLRS